METAKKKSSKGVFDNLIWIGVIVSILYWFGESALHSFVFNDGTVGSQILPHDIHEIWKRSSVFFLIIIFSFYAQSRITERKKMERQIQFVNSELNQIFQTASVGMRLIDLEFNVLRVNQTFSILSGESIENIVGIKCYSQFKGGACHTDNCSLIKIKNGEKEIECETVKNRSDGSTVHCLLTVRPFYGPDGKLKGIVESFKNITDLKHAQENLKNEHDKLVRILFQRFESVCIVRSDFTIEYVNDAFKKKHGDCIGRKCYATIREHHKPCGECIMQKAFRSEKILRYEFNSTSGQIFEQTYTPFTETDGEKKVVVSIRNVTEAKTAKALAYRAEQLAALGELAAGVAHEINNPINGIINYAQILLNKNSQDDDLNIIAGRIRKESNRVARIVESLLSFSRRESQSKIPVDLSEILEDSITLIHSQMRKESIIIMRDIPPNLPRLHAIPQEIQQVFINILSNARYSLNKKFPNGSKNKLIRIKAESLNVEQRIFVRISFMDFGLGISKNIINKVINPFFSTKPKGDGTGLGLSISHGIVSEHNGRMSIDSIEDEYAHVIIDLPAVFNISKQG